MAKPDRPPIIPYRSPQAAGKRDRRAIRNQIGAAVDSAWFVTKKLAAGLYAISQWLR